VKFVAKSDTKELSGGIISEIKILLAGCNIQKQRNKVKRIVRNDLKEEQNLIAQQYKSNPKKILEVCQYKN